MVDGLVYVMYQAGVHEHEAGGPGDGPADGRNRYLQVKEQFFKRLIYV